MVCLDTDVLIGLLKGDNEAIILINKLQSIGEVFKNNNYYSI